MKKCYNSISESLVNAKEQKKKLLESRSTCSSSPSLEGSFSDEQRCPPPASRQTPAGVRQSKSSTNAPRSKGFKPPTSWIQVKKGSVLSDNEGQEIPPRQVKFGLCVVCCTRSKTHVFVPCGHLCACAACSDQTMKTNAQCPICRKESHATHRVFLS